MAFGLYHDDWTYLDAFYFTFDTFTTIGFGDLAIEPHPAGLCFVYMATCSVGVGATTLQPYATQAATQAIQPATLHTCTGRSPNAPCTSHALQVGVGVTAVIVASMTEADFGRDIGAAWRSVAHSVARSSERWRATSPSITSTGSAAQIQPTAQRKLPCEVVVDVELRTG